MDMTKEQRDKLRTLALAATPGEWKVASDQPAYAIYAESGWRVVQTPNQNNRKQWGTSNDTHGIGRFSDAAYIAAANPATLLALLDRIDELEAELAEAKVDAERYKDAISDAFTALDEVGEINPSNYDHDHVCQMNSAYCEAFNIIYEATAPEQEGE